MRENSRKLRFETSMSLISRGHVLAKVTHVGRITLRDMSALRVMSLISRGHVLAKVSHVGRITLRDMSALRVTR